MDFGRLACTNGEQPYVVPIYFVYEPDRLYGFSTLGRKIEWMRANPRVCVEADEVISFQSWSCVVANGHYEELKNEERYASARRQAFELLKRRFLWWQGAFGAEQPRHPTRPAPPVLYRIQVTDMTGRTASVDEFDQALPQQHFTA